MWTSGSFSHRGGNTNIQNGLEQSRRICSTKLIVDVSAAVCRLCCRNERIVDISRLPVCNRCCQRPVAVD